MRRNGIMATFLSRIPASGILLWNPSVFGDAINARFSVNGADITTLYKSGLLFLNTLMQTVLSNSALKKKNTFIRGLRKTRQVLNIISVISAQLLQVLLVLPKICPEYRWDSEVKVPALRMQVTVPIECDRTRWQWQPLFIFCIRFYLGKKLISQKLQLSETNFPRNPLGTATVFSKLLAQ